GSASGARPTRPARSTARTSSPPAVLAPSAASRPPTRTATAPPLFYGSLSEPEASATVKACRRRRFRLGRARTESGWWGERDRGIMRERQFVLRPRTGGADGFRVRRTVQRLRRGARPDHALGDTAGSRDAGRPDDRAGEQG